MGVFIRVDAEHPATAAGIPLYVVAALYQPAEQAYDTAEAAAAAGKSEVAEEWEDEADRLFAEAEDGQEAYDAGDCIAGRG